MYKHWLTILRIRAHQAVRWIVKRDIPTYLLFVALATMVWWGRAMSSLREANLTVPVVYTNIPEQAVFDTPLPDRLRITIRDNGKQLRAISRARLAITVDIAPQLDKQEGTVAVNAEILRPKLQDILPGSAIILQVQPESIEAEYHKQAERKAEVRIAGTWTLAPQYQMTEPPTVEPAQVSVYGKQADIKDLRVICTDTVRLQNLHDTVRYAARLAHPANTRVVPDEVTVTFITEQFTEKVFTLPVEITGTPEHETLRLFPQEVTVSARVGMPHFADVNADDFRVVCRFPQEEQASVPVEVVCTNPHVTKVRTSPNALEYIIER